MKINELILEADFDMDYSPAFDKHGSELDQDDDSVAVKLKGEPMQVQLMRIEDSEAKKESSQRMMQILVTIFYSMTEIVWLIT